MIPPTLGSQEETNQGALPGAGMERQVAIADGSNGEHVNTGYQIKGLGHVDDADVTTPSPARMYDYYLGGTNNFPADREAAERALSAVPCGRQVAWANRKFLVRTVQFLAHTGIDQFIDLGTGIPTSPNVHETARSVIPGARVAYVDNDPIVVVHNKALLAESEGVTAARRDIRYPLNIISNHAIREIIDFNRPVGVLFAAVLHFITSQENPYRAVATFRDRMAAGSCIVISHITSDGTDPATMSTIDDACKNASAPAEFRRAEEIEELFNGFDLLEPGVVEVSDWRSNNHEPAARPSLRFLGGVGRKP